MLYKYFNRFHAIIIIAAVICICRFVQPSYAQDYQYQYFAKDKDKENKVPFSDYNPRSRLHWQVVPHYVEDFYLLYGMKLYYDENSLRENIRKLSLALSTKFRHPSQAIVKIETEAEYQKYQNLMLMHINYLLMRDTMKIAARYDKQKIYFYNLDFAKAIDESLDIADSLYAEALPYWKEVKKYAEKASQYKITTELSFMESERYSIIHGDTNFEKTIAEDRAKIQKKKGELAKALAANK
jgi:hypothetical protein